MISQSYPIGVAVVCKRLIPAGSDYREVEMISLQLYIHPNGQSFIMYNDGYDFYTISDQPYFVYTRADISQKDDGVPKRITITGFPVEKFTGGSRAAMITLVHPFYGTAARSWTNTQSLANPLFFDLQKPDPHSMYALNEAWTGLGGFRVELRVFATHYAGQEIFAGDMLGMWFRIKNLSITAANTEVPFTPQYWDFLGSTDEDEIDVWAE
ncbi:MAG: hypothetical protein LBD20_00055 [Spirochaetaceae bacterium]|jgi:hypothetical protein|nr:hypothetical protein [Spirochaetaceae bacterium]